MNITYMFLFALKVELFSHLSDTCRMEIALHLRADIIDKVRLFVMRGNCHYFIMCSYCVLANEYSCVVS